MQMSNLPSLTPDKIIKTLRLKGFVLDRIKGSHHIYYLPKKKIRVIVQFHKKDLPIGTYLAILKSAGINKEELENLI